MADNEKVWSILQHVIAELFFYVYRELQSYTLGVDMLYHRMFHSQMKVWPQSAKKDSLERHFDKAKLIHWSSRWNHLKNLLVRYIYSHEIILMDTKFIMLLLTFIHTMKMSVFTFFPINCTLCTNYVSHLNSWLPHL